MPGELYLPEEIISCIVQYFEVPQINQSEWFDRSHTTPLARLSRVSRQFQRLSEPLLYQFFPGRDNVNPVSWLKAVLARPERARSVQHVTVHEFIRWRRSKNTNRMVDEGKSENEEDYSESDPFTFREHSNAADERWLQHVSRLDGHLVASCERLIAAAEPQGLMDHRHRDHRRIQLALSMRRSQEYHGNTNMDLIMSLIVLACPNIQPVDISVCDGLDFALLPIALALFRSRGAMSRVTLRRVHERDEHYESGGVGALDGIFSGCGVTSIHAINDSIRRLNPIDSETNTVTLWRSTQAIYLTDCDVPPAPMGMLLHKCPNLTSLTLSSTTGAVLTYLETHGSLLRQHARGLRRLVIDAGDSWYRDDEELDHQMWRGAISGVGSLKDLVNLVELKATPWTLLHGLADGLHLIDLLPESLRSLTILPCLTDELRIDIDEEIRLLQSSPAFADLAIQVEEADMAVFWSDREENDYIWEDDEPIIEDGEGLFWSNLEPPGDFDFGT